ncbi:MAG: hypothetical protein GY941_11010 [Planctomycetes bacterium]|nr:hypothetical protein [Planctomycetota bacterium]
MREHFGIDRLIEYGTTPVDETVKVVNPAYRDIERIRRSTRHRNAACLQICINVKSLRFGVVNFGGKIRSQENTYRRRI